MTYSMVIDNNFIFSICASREISGETSWADYVVQLNIAARLNGWVGSQKATELATSLGGNAWGVLADIMPEQQLNSFALVNKLTQKFEPEGQLRIYLT